MRIACRILISPLRNVHIRGLESRPINSFWPYLLTRTSPVGGTVGVFDDGRFQPGDRCSRLSRRYK